MKRATTILGLAATVAAASACNMIPVQMHTSTTIQHADGTVEHSETHWQGTLDQLPAQLSKAGGELARVTGKMVKELTDVPPPGKVQLADLGPGLQTYQGNPQCDFLINAKDDDGNPIDFQYVQLGAPSYDQFFKDAQVIYAIVYQADQTVHRMVELASKLTNQKVDASAQLSAAVNQAVTGSASADNQGLVDQLKQLQQMAATLGSLVATFASKITKLVSDGQALITGAAASLTNPKVVTHLGLIKDGLGDSVKVIKNSGELIVKLAGELGGFVSGGGSSSG
jgi:hypothetical protein